MFVGKGEGDLRPWGVVQLITEGVGGSAAIESVKLAFETVMHMCHEPMSNGSDANLNFPQNALHFVQKLPDLKNIDTECYHIPNTFLGGRL